jgi:hypothetical protein
VLCCGGGGDGRWMEDWISLSTLLTNGDSGYKDVMRNTHL